MGQGESPTCGIQPDTLGQSVRSMPPKRPLGLKLVETVGYHLRLTSGAEHGFLVRLQDRQPGIDIGCMVVPDIRGQVEICAEKSACRLDNDVLDSVILAADADKGQAASRQSVLPLWLHLRPRVTEAFRVLDQASGLLM